MKRLTLLSLFAIIAILALAACTAPAPAADVADCNNRPSASPAIKVESPWTMATNRGEASSLAPATPAMGGTVKNMSNPINTAAFMVIHNCGMQPDTLVKAASNVEGMTSLMSFEIKDGKSKMTDISQVDIPAGKKVELKSGGYHVMLMNLRNDLKPGDSVELSLSFKNAGNIRVVSPVKNPQ